MSVSILSKQIIKKTILLINYILKLISVFNSILLFVFNMFFAIFVTVTACAIVYFQAIEWDNGYDRYIYNRHCADANE